MNLQEMIVLSRRCWYQTGGDAKYFAEPKTLEELEELISWGETEGLPRFLLGHGSNVLFADEGFDGLVIHTKKLKAVREMEEGLLEAEAGAPLESLVDQANGLGWQGLESFPGIPGTIGGAVWGNAGACGEEIGNRVSQVQLMEAGGPGEWIDASSLCWSYRCSGIEDRVVAAVRLQLSPGSDPQQLKNRSCELKMQKMSTQPYSQRSCGCIFRNPVGASAGELIEKSGLKGVAVGGARISRDHANFIVNEGGARSEDIEELIERVQRRVRDLFQVNLVREVIMPGQRGGSR
jgi:UDP-N-acetylmuramate dehydrogenase